MVTHLMNTNFIWSGVKELDSKECNTNLDDMGTMYAIKNPTRMLAKQYR